jgi:hypothetical protein
MLAIVHQTTENPLDRALRRLKENLVGVGEDFLKRVLDPRVRECIESLPEGTSEKLIGTFFEAGQPNQAPSSQEEMLMLVILDMDIANALRYIEGHSRCKEALLLLRGVTSRRRVQLYDEMSPA